MEKLSKIILKYKVLIICLFAVVSITSIFLMGKVKINYNLSDYLPEDAESIVALDEMSKYYPSTIPNVKLMIPNVSIEEALNYKKEIMKVENVKEVLWADNYIDISATDETQLQDWYKNKNALFLININTKDSLKVIKDIEKVVKEDSLMAGDAVNIAMAQHNVQGEMKNIMFFAVPIILIIMFLTTSSWFEPLLFLITIGIAIVINLGTNIIFGEISSITQSAVAILQLAVSMDYAIFLLHRFASLRHDGQNVEEAMRGSIRDSAPTIVASALTTILGFLALVVMRFGIGPDLGIVLAKGVVLSLVSVLLVLPILAVFTYKIIDKTHHKSFIPSFNKVGKGIVKSRFAILVIVLLLMIPSIIASQSNTFMYGSSGINSEDSKVYKDTLAINKEFGIDNQMVLLIPVGDYQKELKITTDLNKLNNVIGVNSFVTTFGLDIPIQYLPKELVSQFISDKYSRIIINTDVEEEGKETFALVEKIKDVADDYYKGSYYLAGISATNYDMKNTITEDNLLVNILAIVSIIAVLIVTFRSLLIPLVLIVSIETAIWINLSIAYLSGSALNYIGFLIISTVQLGATVDYAILFAKKYLGKKNSNPKERAISTIKETAPSILSSAGILAIAGFSLGFISTNGVISELGTLVGRGSLISAVMVLLFIPAVFIISDKFINKIVVIKQEDSDETIS